MKRISTLLAGFLIVASLFAQMPERISYQAVIRDSNNQLVNNQQVGMRISIIRGSADGMVVYSETLAPETNGNGLVSIEIGGEAGFASIDWSDGPYFLKTETDPSGGTSYTITGTSQLLTVPYALHAKTAETISGGISVDYSELTGRPVLSPVVESGNYNDLVGTPELADVALSGAWEDLSDKPSLFDGDYNSLSNLPVLFDGDYNSLNNLPVLFDGDYNSLTNIPILFDGDYNSLTNIPILFDGSYNSLTDKPSLFDGQYSSLSGIPGFAAVSFSGSYDDLSDKPGLQAVALSGEYSDLSGTPDLSDVALSGDFSDLSGVPNFADVAVSGDYSDLSGTPDLSSYLESESDPVFSASPASSITGAGSGIVISDAERAKLAAIEAEANKYVHPGTHPASMIEQEADLRFMTDAERSKLAAIEAEANKYVHPGTHPASMIVQEEDLRFMTDSERDKLEGIEAGAQVNVKADWTANEGDAQILNRPDLAVVAISGDYNDLENKPELSAVAQSGKFSDLEEKPTTIAGYGITDAFSGSYSDLSDRPDLSEYATKDMGNERLVNLADPVDNKDAVNKAYVDGKVKTYAIGDNAHGGVVFWVDGDGVRGLVVDADHEHLEWQPGTQGITRARGNGLYAGSMNTAIIIAAHLSIGDDGSEYAASYCADRQVMENGVAIGDWYLPSAVELSLLYQAKAAVNLDLNYNYWSSTEMGMSEVLMVNLADGYVYSMDKVHPSMVRCVRAF